MTVPSSAHRFVVHGRVQGVGYRQATATVANRLGLGGWVRNRDDGAVEGEVQGTDAAALDRFRHWLSQGPPAARVERVDWTMTDPAERHAAFSIRHS